MDAVTVSLYHSLVAALHERGAAHADQPVTVAEIYQELIPYRGVRERLGFELNADYEHALLRLLAGESELLRLEPTAARDELRQELASPNPYVGLYRKFAACDVWVKIEPRAQAADSASAAPAVPVITADQPLGHPEPDHPAADSAAPAPAATSGQPPATGSAPAATATTDTIAAAPAERRPAQQPATADPGAPSSSCPFCRQAIPAERAVRFCPHCGGDQRSRPCARCGEVIDYAWRYCIACGAAAATVPQPSGTVG
jgi:hypothetical protein